MEENEDMGVDDIEVRDSEVREVKADDIKTDIKEDSLKMKKSTLLMIISGVLAVLFIVSIITGGFRGGVSGAVVGELPPQEAADKAVDYINTNLLQPGTTAKINGIEDSGDLYNVKLDIGGREYDSYVTKDGKLLFPSAVDLEAEVERPAQQEQPAEVTKSDKPEV